jgi:hypothetical protein
MTGLESQEKIISGFVCLGISIIQSTEGLDKIKMQRKSKFILSLLEERYSNFFLPIDIRTPDS